MTGGVANRSTLILWDIDHTLIDVGSVSREIYAQAFLEVTRQPLQRLADMTGRTEKAILVDTLALHGVPATPEILERFYAALADAASGLRAGMRAEGRRLPGAHDAISALSQHGVVQTVVTGNIKPIAIAKLEVFDLARQIDFEIGGFGSDDGVRSTLVRYAWRRAELKYGLRFRAGRVVVVGDTRHDVQAARETGVRSVAVATGSATVDDLASAGANAVVADLADTESFLNAVLNDSSPA